MQRTVQIAVMLVLVAILAACTTMTPRQRLYQTTRVAEATVVEATSLRRQGVIDAQEAAEITPYIDTLRAAINAAHAAYKTGGYGPHAIQRALVRINAVLAALTQQMTEVRDESDQRTGDRGATGDNGVADVRTDR